MIKLLGYLFFLVSFEIHALVPVEGILMGEAQEDIQSDPLKSVFNNIYDESVIAENKKVKLYRAFYQGGENLTESCSFYDPSKYKSVWQEKQAKRTVAATLQYLGLDLTIKALGAYAKSNNVNEDDFKKLSSNLVKNYCSKNVTVFSLKTIERSLLYYYSNPLPGVVPSLETSPFAPSILKEATARSSARSREFDLVIKNFRAFCSWGGDPDDYRLMTDYLQNPFIMSFVIKNLLSFKDIVDDKYLSVKTGPSPDTVQVSCTDLICRKSTHKEFTEKFPLSAGSTGITTDLYKLYCHHFRFQDKSINSIPQVKAWLKSSEIEDPIFETSQFISLVSGVPDFFNGVETYKDVPMLAKSSIDERWTLWSKTVLNVFSRELYYEESLKVRVAPRRNRADIASKGFEIDFNITLGELDRIVTDNDKLDLEFDLKLTKNYFRMIRSKWDYLEKNVDMDGQKLFREELAQYINHQLKEKEKLFSQKIWNDDFGRLIGDELLQQAILYRGSMFESYKDEVLRVPVKFSYGIFALSYLRHRGDIARSASK